ncbi:cell wall-binding protein [Azomonas macrocytogenes]|uniref:Uncharacterized protein n=1 Tax=Azomonas macrocytogenes TaxID=69962 RepID=A0A839T6Z2_AZOMA|nr:cell wall-binding protein [Azomonas macrocytogenes]MBB3105277.1 hypothetical protein [Azomonas macrocytogenes]
MKSLNQAPPHDAPDSQLRAAYEEEVRGLGELVARMRNEGSSLEAIVRAVSGARLAQSRRYKEVTPEPLRSRIIARTIAEYGNPDAPDVEHLRRCGKSWKEIIAGALRPGLPVALE